MSHITDIKLLCRLCSVKDDVNVPIFEEDTNVLSKILACLPVKVSLEDNLPKRICDTCFGKLESYYKFRNQAVDTEKQLLNLLSLAEQLVTDSSFTPKETQSNTVFIKEEIDISENIFETSSKSQVCSTDSLGKKEEINISENIFETSSKPQVFNTDSLENNSTEKQSNKRFEDSELADVDEPLSKRRKTSDTLQVTVDESFTADTKTEGGCKVLDPADQSETPHSELIRNEELQLETSDELLPVNDAKCMVIEQEDDGNEVNQINSLEDSGNLKLKDCVVVLGDLENVNIKKYQFLTPSIKDLKSISAFTLKCCSCSADFGSVVSSYINHLITEHSENKDDGVSDQVEHSENESDIITDEIERSETEEFDVSDEIEHSENEDANVTDEIEYSENEQANVTDQVEEEAVPAEKSIVSCKYCDSTFEDEESHQKHLSVVHPYTCARCSRVFMNVHQSLLHTKMHFIMDKRKPEEKHKQSNIRVSTRKKNKSEQEMKIEVIQIRDEKEEQEQAKEEMSKMKEDIKAMKEEAKKIKEKAKQLKEKAKQTKEGTKQAEVKKPKQDPSNKLNEQQKNYNCTECDSKFEDCYQLQRHRVWKHRKKPEKRYEYIKLYKCVLCAKHYPSQQMLDAHKAIHVVDVRTEAETESKPKETHLPKPEPTHLSKPGSTHLSKSKEIGLGKLKGSDKFKPKETSLLKPKETDLLKPKESSDPDMKVTDNPALLNDDDVIEINSDENKKSNIDETGDILDNIEIICNDIEFDNEDSSASDTTEQSQNQIVPLETPPLKATETHQTQLLTGPTETPLQTQSAFPQINFIQPPPLVIPNLGQAVTKFVRMLPGNCSIITMPCTSNSTSSSVTTAPPNITTNNQDVLRNANNAKQLKLIKLNASQPCVNVPPNTVNTPIVLNRYLNQDVEPVFKIQTNVNSTIKFRQIQPKLHVVNKQTTTPDSRGKKEVITLIIEKEKKSVTIETSKIKPQENITATQIVEEPNDEESSSKLIQNTHSEGTNLKLVETVNFQQPNSKLTEVKNLEPNSCIKIDSSDSGESDNNNKEQSENKLIPEIEPKDVIEINSSGDEAKTEENIQETSEFHLLCAVCLRRHSPRHITVKYQIVTCIWCNYIVSVVTKKVELFDKSKSPLATGILTSLRRFEFFRSHIQCNICKLIQVGTEYKHRSNNSLVVCNMCKLKIASMTTILLGIKEKAKHNNSKHTEQNKFCKVTCITCRVAAKIQTITYFNNKIVVCDACRPKLFEIAAVSSSIRSKPESNSEENLSLQTQCYICKDMKHVSDISLFNDKSICSDCKYSVSNFAIFLNVLQKPKRCFNCKKLKKGLQLEELSTYCSKCLEHRPNTCLKCDKSGSLGQCSCKEGNVKSTEAEVSEDEDKLIIDMESENKIEGQEQKDEGSKRRRSNEGQEQKDEKSKRRQSNEGQEQKDEKSKRRQSNEGQEQKDERSKRRQSNGSSSSSIEILEAAEETSMSQEASTLQDAASTSTSQEVTTEDIPCTSTTNILPKIFLKPMHSLLEPTAKCIIQKEMNDQKADTFACFYCSLVCNSKGALSIHKDNVHLCRICKKYRENVPQHLKNLVKCQICQAVFCKKFTLGDHYRQRHDSRWCAICDIVLRDDYDVLVHRKIVHNQS